MRHTIALVLLFSLSTAGVLAQDAPAGRIVGRLTDETGGALPGVMVDGHRRHLDHHDRG
jgi:hypothetical protein